MSDSAPRDGDGIEQKDLAPAKTTGIQALLVSGDIQTIDILCHFMGKMAMHVEVCSDFAIATAKLSQTKFEALVVDFKQVGEALALVKKVRQINSHKAAVVLAIVSSNDEMPGAFRAGTSFVLVKPLSGIALARTLKVAYPLMVHEKRRYFRCPLQIPVHVSGGTHSEFVATSINISEGGMALTNAPGLKVGDPAILRLIVPGTQATAKVTARVCWRNDAGVAGMQFVVIPAPVKEQLISWLADRLEEFLPEEANVKG
jgi:ActR/RegA family two-component response regulator